MTPRERSSAERLGTGLGLLLAVIASIGVYQLAEFIAHRWNPFS